MTDKPSPDSALLDLFRAELETHLATLSAGVLSLEKAAGDPQQLESLMRAAHSIKGAAKIVGFDAAVQVSHHLEDCFVAAQRAQIRLTSESVDVLLRGVDALARVAASPEGGESEGGLSSAAVQQLVEEIAALRNPPPDAPVSPGPAAPPGTAVAEATASGPASGARLPGAPVPPAAAETSSAANQALGADSRAALFEFVSEAKEHLAGVVQDLLALEQRPGEVDNPRIQRLLRAMHSVKGGAGFVGCRVIEELAHAMESVLEQLPQTGVAPEAALVDALLAGTDRVSSLVDDAQRSNLADIGDLLQRLEQCFDALSAGAPLPAADGAAAEQPRPAAETGSEPAAASRQTGKDTPPKTVPAVVIGPDRAATVRIPVPLVDRLMTLAGELVLVRNQALRSIDAGEAAIRPVLQRLDTLTSQLQGAITQTRMQPVGNLFAKFPRTVRDLARQMGKAIELEVLGTEVELDKSVLELLSDPLTHLIRNCCDHGLESPQQRVQAGKPPAGHVVLNARQQGSLICIEVSDDGRGIDTEQIKRKALEHGLRTAAELARLNPKEALGLITLPGFSTAVAVTDLSGRGVGMDVVKTNLDCLGGTLEIDSTLGAGTTFSLRVPLTLAIIPCLMVRSGEQRYAIPQKDLEELVCLHPQQTQTRIEYTLDQEVVRLRDQLLPLVRLVEVLDHPQPLGDRAREAIVRKYRPSAADPGGSRQVPGASESLPNADQAVTADVRRTDVADVRQSAAGPAAATFFAVVKVGARRCGLVVDQILKNEEIVVKPMHGLMKPLACFSGATILGDGQVALILNMEGIVQHANVRFGTRVEQQRVAAAGGTALPTTPSLLFEYGPQEQFAVPLAMLRRLVMIDPQRIERVGAQEFMVVDGESMPLLRLDRLLSVSAGVETDRLFLLLPKNVGRPLGFLATSIIDTEALPEQISRTAFQADGVVGSAILRGRMTLLLDLCRLAELHRAGPAGPSAGPAQHANKRILVVDDTEFFRELVRGYLEEEGYGVVTAADGSEALERLESGDFDLLVSDIEMPVMNGWALARAVRERPAVASLPLLALTTLSSDTDRARAAACGFDGYEVKLDRQRFVQVVAELLKEHERARPS